MRRTSQERSLLDSPIAMITEARHIDLHLPRGWNQCTTDELEQIAAAIILEQMTADRYHPFDWLEVKVRAFLSINHLEMLAPMEEGFNVRFAGEKHHWWQRRKKQEPFLLTTGHVHAIISEFFAWLDDEKADPLMRPPYKPITPLLDGYVWQEYRLMQDWMDVYVRTSNRLATLPAKHPQYNNVRTDMMNARNNFLDILLRKEHASKDIDDIKWQVILFWWSGLMRVLMRKYPRCFKQEKNTKRKQRPQNPLNIYTSIIATMQTKTHLSEETIDKHTSYQVVLEQLERLAKESEEMEKLNRKHGSR